MHGGETHGGWKPGGHGRGPRGGQVSGWRTRVYEATGRLAAVSIAKAAVKLPEGGTFEEYCAMSAPRDARQEARPSLPPLPPSSF